MEATAERYLAGRLVPTRPRRVRAATPTAAKSPSIQERGTSPAPGAARQPEAAGGGGAASGTDPASGGGGAIANLLLAFPSNAQT